MILYTHTWNKSFTKYLLLYKIHLDLVYSPTLLYSTLFHEKTKHIQAGHDPQNWFHNH